MKLQTKLVLFIGSLMVCVIGILVASYEYMAATTLRQQIGERALNIAQTVAMIPDIRNAFAKPDPSKIIQPIAEAVAEKTGAEFVVVGNRADIRYSHPVPARIGEKMVGGDDSAVLDKGQSIIEQAIGTLGPSLRGKVPIYNNHQQIIGIVSVGFQTAEVDSTIARYRNRVILFGIFALLIGITGALLVSRRVKAAILGLEPEEIGRLYQERGAILESIREGIVAVDSSGVITMANKTACKLFGIREDDELVKLNIEDIHPNSQLPDVLHSGSPIFDWQFVLRDAVIVANTLPVVNSQGETIGAVSSFRERSELNRLTNELSQVRAYAEALRAQTHDYSNKLYMISGLIQLESYSEAIEFITHEFDIQQNMIRFIMEDISDPMVGGLLIGKFNRANELQVSFRVNPESSFRDVPETINRDYLITIIGNLIDNAMEAVLSLAASNRNVSVFLTDLGHDLIIEVEDTGPGISESEASHIFDTGFSTKSEKNHGFGLALVKHAVTQLQGYLTFSSTAGVGTIFTVIIPKGGSES